MKTSLAMTVFTCSPEQTLRLAVKLGEFCRPGDVVALVGELGTGKTLFAKGLAQGLGVPPDEPVVSPSFTLLNEYTGRCPVYHFDFYRLADAGDMENLGLEEYLGSEGVIIVEWAERIPQALSVEHLEIHMEYAGENRRTITISGTGPRGTELVREWQSEAELNSISDCDTVMKDDLLC